MSASDSIQNEATLKLFDYYNWDKFAILVSSSSYGRDGVSAFLSEALLRRWTITTYEVFEATGNPTDVDVRDALLTIKQSGDPKNSILRVQFTSDSYGGSDQQKNIVLIFCILV